MIESSVAVNPDEVLVNPDAEVLTFDLEAGALTFDLEEHALIESDPDAITVNPDVDAVVVKYEYIIVDAEKQTSRCVISTSPSWDGSRDREGSKMTIENSAIRRMLRAARIIAN
jgi:hypothetical protein